jgi:hypothetical protein
MLACITHKIRDMKILQSLTGNYFCRDPDECFRLRLEAEQLREEVEQLREENCALESSMFVLKLFLLLDCLFCFLSFFKSRFFLYKFHYYL